MAESAKHIRQGSTALRNALSDRSPDSLHIEIEDQADGGEGKTVVGIGQKPLPRLVPLASAGSAAPVASVDLQILESILKDGQAQAAQPAVCRRMDDLHG